MHIPEVWSNVMSVLKNTASFTLRLNSKHWPYNFLGHREMNLKNRIAHFMKVCGSFFDSFHDEQNNQIAHIMKVCGSYFKIHGVINVYQNI